MKSVFISYSRDDLDFVEKNIISEIEEINEVNCWLDVHDIESGAESFPDDIDIALKECFIFLIVLSKSSMKKDWPLRELKDAEKLKKEDSTRKVVLVNIDDSELFGDFKYYEEHDIIFWNATYQHRKLLRDIERWNRNKAAKFVDEGLILEKSALFQDQEEAFRLFSVAAEMGYAEAQSKIAFYYKTGKNGIVEKDLGKALQWCSRAFKQGYAPAYSLMGNISLEMGDNGSFIKYQQDAAERGWPYSQYKLGETYYRGILKGGILNAIYWLKKAADQNQPDAIKLLGHILSKDFKHQEELAKEYLSKATNLKNK